jgi:hypothetical protein
MVSPHTLHQHMRWGSLLAYPPLPSAEMADRFLDRSYHYDPPMNAWSRAREQGPREKPPQADPRAVSGGAASTARSTTEPHGGIISGWRVLRSAHGDPDPVSVGAEIRHLPRVDRVGEKVCQHVTRRNSVA